MKRRHLRRASREALAWFGEDIDSLPTTRHPALLREAMSGVYGATFVGDEAVGRALRDLYRGHVLPVVAPVRHGPTPMTWATYMTAVAWAHELLRGRP